MRYPILPAFLTVALGAPAAVVGIIEGPADGLASMTTVVSGSIADRARRRPLAVRVLLSGGSQARAAATAERGGQ